MDRREELKNTLIKGRKNILLQRSRYRLQRLVCLTVIIVVLHVFHGGEGRLHADRVAFVSRVRERLPNGGIEDVGFSVLSSHLG